VQYEIAWDLVWSSLPVLLHGAVLTLRLAGLGIVAGVLIGVVGVNARLSRIPWLRAATRAYVEIVRNTPILVQLYFVYHALPRMGIRLDSFESALAALALYCGAYVIEILRSGIEAVDRGQVEAATSSGLTPAATFRFVVLPQATRIALPALTGQFISMLKLSSLASVIGAVELTYLVNDAVAFTYRSFELYAMAGIVYLVMTLASAGLLRLVEARLRVAT
jgi:His/Glu/Gln/Arg/opine family amino acid ABC transporter permease subunit